MADSSIDRLIHLLARLPGLGPRSARRAVLHLLKKREAHLHPLIEALAEVDRDIKPCSLCGNYDTNDPCNVCSDAKRDATSLCIVADVADLWALERTAMYRGHYHVLGGFLSALDGVGPDDLAIGQLLRRLEKGGIREVILALGATLDGQATGHYVADRIASYAIPISRLAHGLPVGGELDYLDDGTLIQALKARQRL